MTPLAGKPWSMHAARWSGLGPPLRPRPEDLQRMYNVWRISLSDGNPEHCLQVLSLGVTPEFTSFRWAPDFKLIAVDSSPDMIQTVWPGDGPNRKAVLGEWLRMPLAAASYDLVLCDGGLAQLGAEARLLGLASELRRVLRKNGRVVMRHFARPAKLQSREDIINAVGAGELRNFHALKLLLLMAVEAETPEFGVRLGDVHSAFQEIFPERALLANRLGCDLRSISTIDAYRGQNGRYAFPSLDEVAALFSDFLLSHGSESHDPSGEVWPVFSLTPKT